MKNIAVVTDTNSYLAKFIKENLNMILSGFVNINNYYLNEMKANEVIDDDIILAMTEDRAIEIRKYVSSTNKIFVVNRTVKSNEVYKIFSLPKGIDVLVVNDNKQTTLQTVSLLYKIGIEHLNLIPYEEGRKYCNIKIAITPGETQKVPDFIETIIDIGHRHIDISTFISIIARLNISNKEVSKRLIEYYDMIISLDTGIKDNYKELVIKNDEFETIINLSTDGIILTDEDGKIIITNKSFINMFEIKEDIQGRNINEIFEEGIRNIIFKDELNDEIIKYRNKYFNVNKSTIKSFEFITGIYYNIKEITYIKQLEQNLSKKLKESGQIARYNFNDIKTSSQTMLKCIELAKKIANSNLTVLITGESGTGKELIAQSIHNASPRANQPFIAVNCAAMPENLLESELFGYEPGAFTGALKEGKKGLFEQAHNGTIFLDEIGDMSLILQTKLLRVLQEMQVMRIGSEKVIDINVRVIAATNKNLFKMVSKNQFREDLFYRLNVLPINIPPLRQRKGDVLLLIEDFLEKKLIIDDEVKKILENHNWPGNIRELKNVASYISLMAEEVVDLKSVPYYLLNFEGEFEKLLEIIKNKYDEGSLIKVLNIIYGIIGTYK